MKVQYGERKVQREGEQRERRSWCEDGWRWLEMAGTVHDKLPMSLTFSEMYGDLYCPSLKCHIVTLNTLIIVYH